MVISDRRRPLCVPWLGKGLSMSSPNDPVFVSLQYLSRSSLHRLAGLPCRPFLSYGLQVVMREKTIT